MLTLIIENSEQTIIFAELISKSAQKRSVFSLSGELGSGKTFFTKYFCKSLGIKDNVNSPTYLLLNIYSGKIPVFHLDLYRLTSPDEILELGLYELFENGITIIEWPEIAEDFLPQNTIKISFKTTPNSNEKRIININGEENLLNSLKGILASKFKITSQ